jgi:hypothetical protein
MFLTNEGELCYDHNPMPFRPLPTFAIFVEVWLLSGDRKVDDRQSDRGVADFWVSSQAADKHDFVE